jgi:tRNA pseudouridine55 synthase
MCTSANTPKQLPENAEEPTTSRMAGGLSLGAAGAKRRGRTASPSLRVTAGANYPAGESQLSGIIVVDKPPNISSAKVVANVKRLLHARKVGHAGTLDPFAEGVLICCINNATRLARFLLSGNKTYDATLKLGIETDTQDLTGKVIAVHPVIVGSEDSIKSVIQKFEGPIEQQPPVFSALKHRGTPLYKLARKGKPIQKPARQVYISKIKILEINLPLIRLEVLCSAGTYIRTLCADIGRQLGCGGHLLALKRVASSGFKIEQALTLQQLAERVAAGESRHLIVGMADALADMPACVADQNLIEKIRQGQHLKKSDVKIDGSIEKSTKQDEKRNIKIVDGNNLLLAVLNYEKNTDRISYACVFTN